MNDILVVAQRQYGVVTRAQARAAGLTERQLDVRTRAGALEIVHPGVYRIPGSYASARQRAMAAVLWCGSHALLSHTAAATLLRLPVPWDDRLHVSVPHAVRRARCPFVLHRTDSLIASDRFMVDELPCTSPTRTIVDLAATLDAEQLEHLFEAARRMGLASTRALERRVEALGRANTALRELLRVADGRPKESRLEVRVARLLRTYDMPPAVAQHRVEDFRLDFA